MEVIRLPTPTRASKAPYCELAAYREIRDTLTLCQRLGQIGVITGPTGCGKTTACKAFFANNSDVRYLRVTIAANSAQPFLHRFCEAINAYPQQNAGKYDLYDLALRRLNGGDLVIIDEGNHLTPEVIHLLRDLHDEMRSSRRRVGIALVGTPEMTELWTKRRPGKNSDAFAAFRARIGQMVELKGPCEADIDELCGHFGLKGRRERDVIAKLAKGWDGLHNVDQLMVNAQALAGADIAVTSEHLFGAAEVMGGRA